MPPRWYPTVIAATLYEVRDRPAIDLEMASQIPSEVWHSFHNQATRRRTPLRNSADENCAQKRKNQKNLADETVSRFHGTYYAYNWFPPVLTRALSPIFEVARMLVRLDYVARVIVSANHRVWNIPRPIPYPFCPLLRQQPEAELD